MGSASTAEIKGMKIEIVKRNGSKTAKEATDATTVFGSLFPRKMLNNKYWFIFIMYIINSTYIP